MGTASVVVATDPATGFKNDVEDRLAVSLGWVAGARHATAVSSPECRGRIRETSKVHPALIFVRELEDGDDAVAEVIPVGGRCEMAP